MLHRSIALLLLLNYSLSGLAQSCTDAWEMINPKITLDSVNTLTYAHDRFFAIGSGGVIYNSTDGAVWEKERVGTSDYLSDLTWGNGLYVSVSINGNIYTSKDAQTWSLSYQNENQGSSLKAIIRNSNRFVAIGSEWHNSNQAIVLSSQDGLSWQRITFPEYEFMYLHSVASNSESFIIGGTQYREKSPPEAIFLHSQDGVQWQRQIFSEAIVINRIMYAGQYWFSSGSGASVSDSGSFNNKLWRSSDGKNWTVVIDGDAARVTNVIWDGTQYVAMQSNQNFTVSEDGANWHKLDTPFYGNSMTWGKGWLMVLSNGSIYRSQDAQHWDNPLSLTSNVLSAGIWDGNKFVVIDVDTVLHSEEGIHWQQSAQNNPLGNQQLFKKLVWNGSRYVAISYRSPNLFISEDAAQWQAHEITGVERLNDLIWDGEKFVAVGYDGVNAIVLTSADGNHWQTVYVQAAGEQKTELLSLTTTGAGLPIAVGFSHVGGAFIANKSGRPLVVKQDAQGKWNYQLLDLGADSERSQSLNAVAWNGQSLLAVGSQSNYRNADGTWVESVLLSISSSDGKSWEQHEINLPVRPDLFKDLAWDGKKFIAVGSNGMLLTTPDGISWQQPLSNTNASLNQIVADGAAPLILGDRGTILRGQCGEVAQIGQYVDDKLWIRAVIQTMEKGLIEARWQLDGTDTTTRGDRVIWGHFYADPESVDWGHPDNPDLFVKIWYDASGRLDVNYFHVSVPEIMVYSAYDGDPAQPDSYSRLNMWQQRYVRHYFEQGQSYQEIPPLNSTVTDDGTPQLSSSTLDQLRISTQIHSETAGIFDGLWQLGGQAQTSRGDRVLWGHFYADPQQVNWGNLNNPDMFVKIWFDFSGRIDVNYFHVSVPDIGVFSDYPADGTFDQKHLTGMSSRYQRHEFWLK